MKFTNNEIYALSQSFMKITNSNEIKFPIKANFFMQKNAKVLAAAAQEIEEARIGVAKVYGIYDEQTNVYNIPREKMATAAKELEDLFNIEQELDIKKIKFEELGSVELTPAQMQVLMFMIDDEA